MLAAHACDTRFNMNTPSADALQLAIKLSGHEGTQCKYGARICEGCIADARIIDDALQLPQRNAALMLAQGMCDEDARVTNLTDSKALIDQLRDALARITTK